MPDGTTLFIVYILNYSGGETSLKPWTRIRKTFRKSRRLSTHEDSKEWHNIECCGHAAEALKIHVRHLTTWTIVLRSLKSSNGSSSGRHKMRGIFEDCQTPRYQFMWTWYLLPPPIMVCSHWVFQQDGKVFNGDGLHK